MRYDKLRQNLIIFADYARHIDEMHMSFYKKCDKKNPML